MKKLITYLLLLMIAFQLSSCNTFEDLFKNTGPVTTEERTLSFIDHIELRNNVDLVVHHDSIFRMRVTAGKNLLEKIETNVSNNTLVIRNNNKFNWIRSFDPVIIVDVWVPALYDLLAYDASGDIQFADTLKADVFYFNNFGSIGTFDLTLQCRESYIKLHTGPGDVILHGKSDNSFVYNAGDGKFNAEDFKTSYSYVRTVGTNETRVNVDDHLDVEIESLGSVYYKGDPSLLNQKITGTGKLIHL